MTKNLVFFADGTGNDEFAIGYYDASDLPVHARLAERFTVFDSYFASLLAGTFPNRMYMHSAQSDGRKEDPVPLDVGIFRWPTIWDKLLASTATVGYFYTDLPVLLLWGEQDRVIPRGYAARFASGIGAKATEIKVIPGAAHLAELDQPEAVARLVEWFLA